MKRALLVGLNYKDSDYELNFCEADVNAISLRMSRCKVETKLVYNNIGIQDLLDLFDLYKAKQKKTDTFYFVYSGHGTQVPNDQEEDKYDEALCLFRNGRIDLFRDDRLRNKLEEFKGQVVVILDTCFSGGMEKNLVQGKRKFILFDSSKVYQITERVISKATISSEAKINFVFASSEDEVSLEGDGNGYFTGSLIKHWDSGIKYIKQLMPLITKDIQESQHPVHKKVNCTGRKKLF